MRKSKPLGIDDISGFEFVKEVLDGDSTYAINFDRLQKHPRLGYIIFEFLLCDAKQSVNPHTSHPRRYWHKNSRKFISLFRVSEDLPAILFLVNYAKSGTPHADKIKVIQVIDLDESGIKEEKVKDMDRAEFAQWFRKLNKDCGG